MTQRSGSHCDHEYMYDKGTVVEATMTKNSKGSEELAIYQHFRLEEHPFIDQVLSWREMVEKTYQPRLSDFLDPRQRQIVQALIGEKNEEIKVEINGGHDDAERKRVMIAPFYEEIVLEDFQLSLLQADFNEKFIQLTHRDVMGAFLSLGIDRSKLGDILIENGIVQIVVADEISPYIMMNLTKIKHANIKFKTADFSSVLAQKKNWAEAVKTVSSLRLDVVLKEIYSMSRKDASVLINRKLVKVNHTSVEEPAFLLQEGDMLSVRGKGRGKLISIDGKTRKNKLRITTAILK